MEHLSEILVTAVVFSGIYYILSLLADYLLKRRLIKSEQYDRVGILDNPKPTTEEVNKYPSLKWGLVALMAGLGLILVEWLRWQYPEQINDYRSALPFGIFRNESFS